VVTAFMNRSSICRLVLVFQSSECQFWWEHRTSSLTVNQLIQRDCSKLYKNTNRSTKLICSSPISQSKKNWNQKHKRQLMEVISICG